MSVLGIQDANKCMHYIGTEDVIKYIRDHFFHGEESLVKIVQDYLHKSHPLCSSTHIYRPKEACPSNSLSFKNAFKQAFDRLQHERIVEFGHAEASWMHLFRIRAETKHEQHEKEVFEHLYKYALNGLCFGQAAAFFKTMERQIHPEWETTKIAQLIDQVEVIYLQLRYHLLPPKVAHPGPFYFPPREPNDHAHALPWHERVTLVYSDVMKRERAWVDLFSHKVEDPYSMGRVSFRVNAKAGHTFAFWHLTEQFGYFNAEGGGVCQFSNCKAFCEAVRNEILKYRRYFGQLDSQDEIRAYHYEMREDPSTPTEYFPVAIYTKPKEHTTIYQRYAANKTD